MSENKKVDLFLAALDPYIQTNIVSNAEQKVNGKDFIAWGDNNGYSQFLWDCYNECTTLQSIINGTADYIAGDEVICNVLGFENTVNKKGETINDIVQRIASDYMIFGAFAIQVIRNLGGKIAEIYWVDINKLRSDEKNEVFFYSDDWGKSYGRVKYITYPKFNPNDENPTSIFYFKGYKTRSTYGTPVWNAAVKNVMIERAITDFHFNEINNNFLGSKMISFNNGTPDDNLRAEIERNLNEKFSGSGNAGRFMISFSESRENAPEVLNLGTDDFDRRYETLEKRNGSQIFVAFRATPVLFGLVTESNGFSTNEYRDSYKIFNRCMIQPIQKNIVDVFDKIFGVKSSITITPFKIDFEEDDNNNKNVQ